MGKHEACNEPAEARARRDVGWPQRTYALVRFRLHDRCLISFRTHVDNFDEFWRYAAKIFPAPGSTQPISSPAPDAYPRSQSTEPGAQAGDKDEANTVRCVPVRIHLPDGPVLQDTVMPLNEDGTLSYSVKPKVLTNDTGGLNRSSHHPSGITPYSCTIAFSATTISSIGVFHSTRCGRSRRG